MTRDEEPRLVAALVAAAEGYGGRKLSEDAILVYLRSLAEFPLLDLMAALGRAVQECKFYPTVAEIRAQLGPTREDAALIAWSTLDQAAEALGGYQCVVFEDAATGLAVERTFGSWADFCALPDGPQKALKRQEFLAFYRQLSRGPRPAGGHAVRGALGPSESPATWQGVVRADGRIGIARSNETPLLGPRREPARLPAKTGEGK